jgi:hypothetical protein
MTLIVRKIVYVIALKMPTSMCTVHHLRCSGQGLFQEARENLPHTIIGV